MFKVVNKDTREWRHWSLFIRLENIRKPEVFLMFSEGIERDLWRFSGVVIANFEHILQFVSTVSIINFEKVNVYWVFLLSLAVWNIHVKYLYHFH